jgi:hypothetical protein
VADRIQAGSSAGPLGVIARHRAAAGDGPRAVPLLVRAADSAFALGARAEAASYLEMAVELEADELARDQLKERAAAIRELNVPVGAGGSRREGFEAG